MIEQIKADYETGKYTIKFLASKYGISTGKAYYLLRDAGCEFIHIRRKPVSDEERKRRSDSRKGIVFTPEWCKAISDGKKCDYNGLNGYGHTKKHCRGYILAYAPMHPHAHADGYIMLHTVIMERHIGRYLKPNEVVHHINRNKADNRIENLQLMDKKEHCSFHSKERHAKRRNDLLTAYSSSAI